MNNNSDSSLASYETFLFLLYGTSPSRPLTQASEKHFKIKEVKSTFMVLSADPVTNHWFPGSTAMDLTQPRWPLMTCQVKPNTVTAVLFEDNEPFQGKAANVPERVSTVDATEVWGCSVLSSQGNFW